MTDTPKKLSTSALARLLDVPAQQLFASLQNSGWISRVENGWILTGKGEFEGGSYQDSARFGRYIVWPEALQKHKLITSIEAQQRLTAAGIARCFDLHPRVVNRALAELSLHHHTLLGWELTALGTRLGGIQEESGNSGVLYVSWPREIVDDPVVRRELELLTHFEAATESADDFFEDSSASGHQGLDGHHLENQLELHVCNWLYLAQLVHAHRRRLPVEEELYADFYLPQVGVYIECWLEAEPHQRLSSKLARQEVYTQMKLDYVDVHQRDSAKLDDVLGKRLRELGLRW